MDSGYALSRLCRAKMVLRLKVRSKKNDRISDRTNYARPQLSTAYVAPRNAVEEIVSTIWKDLLRLEKNWDPRQFL